jgi:predicted acetyltransferase
MTHRDVPTDWTLTDAREDERQLLDRLMQLYCYDFSEFDPDDVGEDGRFDSVSLDRYGREPGYHAFLLRVRGRPAGFALVDEQSPLPDSAHRHYVHEYCVLRAYRRGGYGLAMAWEVFDRFPGLWQIEEIGPNLHAQSFWRRVIDLYTGGRYTERTMQARRFHLVIQEFDTSDKAIP